VQRCSEQAGDVDAGGEQSVATGRGRTLPAPGPAACRVSPSAIWDPRARPSAVPCHLGSDGSASAAPTPATPAAPDEQHHAKVPYILRGALERWPCCGPEGGEADRRGRPERRRSTLHAQSRPGIRPDGPPWMPPGGGYGPSMTDMNRAAVPERSRQTWLATPAPRASRWHRWMWLPALVVGARLFLADQQALLMTCNPRPTATSSPPPPLRRSRAPTPSADRPRRAVTHRGRRGGTRPCPARSNSSASSTVW
jgi:hypothetical protein